MKKIKILALMALLALAFAVPAAVVARGEQKAGEEQSAAEKAAEEELEEFEPMMRNVFSEARNSIYLSENGE